MTGLVGGGKLPSRTVCAWFIFALGVQLFFAMPVGTNPASRWAALCALAEDGSPRIDAYLEHTIDWARGPDGHYYSNKAPGPLLIGYPVFKLLDYWQTASEPDRNIRDGIRYEMRGPNLRVLCFLFQIVPFFFLALMWWKKWEGWGGSRRAREIGLITLLMGTTATVFLNSYFGHGMAAVSVLALAYFACAGAVFWSAFFFGIGVLCEYSVGLLILPLAFFWIQSFWAAPRKGIWICRFFGGALFPALLWSAYHLYCFGGVLTLANQYQNPLFVEPAGKKLLLWGILSLPNPHIAWSLLFGMDRGLFWTQPWVLAVAVLLIGSLPLKKAPGQKEAIGAFVALILFFLLNASFNGWHGGSTPGPRYLSPVLPLVSFALVFLWDSFGKITQTIVAGLVLGSVVSQILFLSVYGLPPQSEPIWLFYWNAFKLNPYGTTGLRLAVGWSVGIFLFYLSLRATRPKTI